MYAEFATARRTPAALPAPNFCEIRIEYPCVRPVMKPNTRKCTEPVEPAAASARTPTPRPSTTASTTV